MGTTVKKKTPTNSRFDDIRLDEERAGREREIDRRMVGVSGRRKSKNRRNKVKRREKQKLEEGTSGKEKGEGKAHREQGRGIVHNGRGEGGTSECPRQKETSGSAGASLLGRLGSSFEIHSATTLGLGRRGRLAFYPPRRATRGSVRQD
jgi:hypothetical protein